VLVVHFVRVLFRFLTRALQIVDLHRQA